MMKNALVAGLLLCVSVVGAVGNQAPFQLYGRTIDFTHYSCYNPPGRAQVFFDRGWSPGVYMIRTVSPVGTATGVATYNQRNSFTGDLRFQWDSNGRTTTDTYELIFQTGGGGSFEAVIWAMGGCRTFGEFRLR